MTPTSTPIPARMSSDEAGAGEQQDQAARLELLEALPVRLAESDLQKIRLLAAEGKTSRTVDPLVALMELRRVREREAIPRPFTAAQQQAADEEARLQRLDTLDMNRLAKGTHVPNVQLRALMNEVVARDGVCITELLRRAGYRCSSHGRRQLGYMRGSGRSRFAQTIGLADAARVVRALGVEPREVVGL